MRHRLKRASVNFIRELAGNPPYAEPAEVVRYIPKETEPNTVFDNQLLAGKNALITGAGRNIGRAIAHEMARQGANIFFTDIEPERVSTVEAELGRYPVSAKGYVSNIARLDDIDTLTAALNASGIEIDILVNNAGIQFTDQKGLHRLNIEEWHKTFETNLFGPVCLTKHMVQTMLANNRAGNIIFTTSIHQHVVFGWPSYSASKAALGMVIKELALELAAHNVRVNGIAPAWVAEDEQGHPYSHPRTPLHGTSINPAYIGRAAVFLASDYFSRFTTGAVLTIDGGVSLHSYMSMDS
jgi:NAD(P)-dependent dehydrogenase (short-subunit alcohol dehydrogenase family)